jgi:hypothetical protein
MFLTTQEKKLSQKEIDQICEKLWSEEKISNCPDCGVKPGEVHGPNCDISRCINCGEQTIFEDCCENIQYDIWSGKWPGVKECYENKLICYDTCQWPDGSGDIGWCFDLNEWARTGRKNS